MQPLFDLNKVENDHPQPMIAYFSSFAERGTRPPEDAVKALNRAIQIAPFDTNLRMNRARFLLSGRNYTDAREDFNYLATNPHLSETLVGRINQVLDRLEAGGNPAPGELLGLLNAPEPAAKPAAPAKEEQPSKPKPK